MMPEVLVYFPKTALRTGPPTEKPERLSWNLSARERGLASPSQSRYREQLQHSPPILGLPSFVPRAHCRAVTRRRASTDYADYTGRKAERSQPLLVLTVHCH